jgi:polysaccharide biosynthesis protein PslH
MKIFILDEFLCYPIDSGKKVRTYNLIRELAKNHKITLLTFVWGENTEHAGIEHLKSLGIKVETVPRNNPQKSGLSFYFKLFTNLFSSLPYIVAGHMHSSYREKLSALVEEQKPDILLAEWSPYAIYLKPFTNLPRVAVAHNLESNIWRGYLEKSNSLLKKKYIQLQYQKVVKFENEIFNWLDGLITVSPVEFDQVSKSHPKLNVELVDNGVDTEYFSPSSAPKEENVISFTGSMDWRPNQDGIEYFILTILPLLREKTSDIKVLIIGRQPPQWLLDLGSKHNVEFTRSVDDVRPYVYRSAISIVPLRIGGGSRLKILEAFAMEKAVVSTSLGAEGLYVKSGEHLIIADKPEDFANAVLHLLKDTNERQRLAKNGRQLVLEKYRWESLAGKQSSFLEKLVTHV